MKNCFPILFLVLILYSYSFAQMGRYSYSSRLSIDVESNNVDKSEKRLNYFVKTNQIKLQRQEIVQNRIKVEFEIDADKLDSIIDFARNLGYITYKDYSYTDNNLVIGRIVDEIKNLSTTRDNYESTVAEKQAQIEELKKNANKIFVQISVNEQDMITSKIAFVNMPGFEYSFLFTENPKKGFSAPYYQAYTLKYLFTRGKSYFALSMMKGTDYSKQDSTLYNEYFMLSFGQDFYTRHLGRGKRRFFNPYTSYQVGCFLASNQASDNKFNVNINVAVGLELIKTRIFLLDTKVSYFLPINKNNVNMRGFQASLSANFLF